MVFAAIFAGIILVAGISWKILAPAFLFVAAVAVGIVALVASPEGQKFLEVPVLLSIRSIVLSHGYILLNILRLSVFNKHAH